MKDKLISITIILLSIIVPIAIFPRTISSISHIPKIATLIFCGAVLLILTLMNYKKLYFDKLDILMLIFAVLIFISTCFSSHIKISIIGMQNRYEGMLSLYTYILLFLCAKKFFKKEYFKNYCKIMYVVVMLICILSICQYYITSIDYLPLFIKTKGGGSLGTFGNSNFLGSFVSIFLPILTSMYIISGKKTNLLLSILLFMSLLVCLARSSWVASIICLFILIIFLLYKRKKEYFIRFLVVAITFSLAFTIINFTGKENTKSKGKAMVNEIKQITTTGITNKNGSGRIAIWKMVLKLALRHPILGVGPENLKYGLFEDEDIKYNELLEYYKSSGASVDKAHNEYLNIAATLGIPALLVYLAFLTIIILKNLKLSFKNNAIFVLLLSIASYLIQAFFNISTIGIAPLFWLILGFINNDEIVKEMNEKILDK